MHPEKGGDKVGFPVPAGSRFADGGGVLFRVLSFRQNRSAHGSVEPTNARVTEAESQPMPTSIDAAVPPPLPPDRGMAACRCLRRG